jgi:orotate phosphoribosyltransferase
VALLDDVITGGGSILKAVAAVRDEGASVVQLLTVVDRRSERSTMLGDLPLEALFTIDEVLDADPR